MLDFNFLLKNKFVCDFHCHLSNLKNTNCLASLLPVKYWVSNALSINQINWHLALNNNNIAFSAGVHPLYLDNYNKMIDKIKNLAKNKKITAIGEIGLDKHKKNLIQQKIVFENQLKIAKEFNLPVILHCVKAYQEIYNIIKCYPSLVYIFHGFTGNVNLFNQFSRLNVYFSISYKFTKKPNFNQTMLAILQTSRYVFESDAENINSLTNINKTINTVKSLL